MHLDGLFNSTRFITIRFRSSIGFLRLFRNSKVWIDWLGVKKHKGICNSHFWSIDLDDQLKAGRDTQFAGGGILSMRFCQSLYPCWKQIRCWKEMVLIQDYRDGCQIRFDSMGVTTGKTMIFPSPSRPVRETETIHSMIASAFFSSAQIEI